MQDPIDITFLEDKIDEFNSLISQEPGDDEEITISQTKLEVFEDIILITILHNQ
jgi:hypothetical protein